MTTRPPQHNLRSQSLLVRSFRPLGHGCVNVRARGSLHFQACRTALEWKRLRQRALCHLHLALRIARYQHSCGLTASFEQPPTCVSWRLHEVAALLELPGWQKFVWPSCVYNHRDPGNGLPYRKLQATLGSRKGAHVLQVISFAGSIVVTLLMSRVEV